LTSIVPWVGLSKPPNKYNNVDFPEPDGPINTVKELGSKDRLMPANAWTTVCPILKSLYNWDILTRESVINKERNPFNMLKEKWSCYV
jgi:hypothetical protein